MVLNTRVVALQRVAIDVLGFIVKQTVGVSMPSKALH